jgi:hypothetical protein
MEDFLTGLDSLIENAEGISAIEVIGALELAQMRISVDLLVDDDDEEDAE